MLLAAEVSRRLVVVKVCRRAAEIFNNKATRVGCMPIVLCVILNELRSALLGLRLSHVLGVHSLV